ncbi:type II secretion system F family protein [Campylobacter sp. TTU_617]|uniref:type II secretion system F family protein n=1 Tax=Campylobacter sp. TTU_617 TaxID=2768148 RepID=UPI0019064F1E|nr:type II secretion system F family protein [Campylobacter sp. TTU_617]MBK1971877.1 type II secretion system F family protein [Campylobacter sp. TTU_617]
MKIYELSFLKNGVKAKKIIKAKNLNTAQSLALKQNLNILELTELKKESFSFFKISNQDFILFFKEFSFLLEAGLSVLEALAELEKSSFKKELKKTIKTIDENLNLGQSLSEAFKNSHFNLSHSELALIKLAENTGKLSYIFNQIVLIRQKITKAKKSFTKSIRYPLIVLISIFISFIFLILFVIPQFKDLFDNFNIKLPLITQILLQTYDFLHSYFFLILVLVFIFMYLFVIFYKKFYFFTLMSDYFFLKIPIISKLILYYQNYHFFSVFSLLLKSGISLNKALEFAIFGVKNEFLKNKLTQILSLLDQGLELSEAFRRVKIFDPLVISMLNIAMKSSKLDILSEQIALFYETKQENIMEKILSLIEPFMTLFVACLVLLLALGIFLPLWEINNIHSF